jgi:hypothetical protein
VCDIYRATSGAPADTGKDVDIASSNAVAQVAANVDARAGRTAETESDYLWADRDGGGNVALGLTSAGVTRASQLEFVPAGAALRSESKGGIVVAGAAGFGIEGIYHDRYRDLTGTDWANARYVEIDSAGFVRYVEWRDGSSEGLKANNETNFGAEISPPAGFAAKWVPDFKIFRTGPRSFSADFDIEARRPFVAAAADHIGYVDPSFTGSSDGSLTAPWKSLYDAIHGRAGKVLIRAKPGLYFRDKGFNGAVPAASALIVEPWGNGRVISTTALGPLIWVSEASYPGVWTTTVSSAPNMVVDLAIKSEQPDPLLPYDSGDGTRYASRSSMSGVASAPGSYRVDGTNLSVRTLDGRQPDANILAVTSASNFVYNVAGGTWYLRDVDVWGGGAIRSTQASASAAITIGYLYRVSCKYSSANGLGIDCPAIVYSWLSLCSLNTSDGFNYHTPGGLLVGVEFFCIGRRNGFNTAGSNNGTTIHDKGVGLRIHCRYPRNQNRCVHDINDHRVWMLGSYSGESQSTDDTGISIASGHMTADVGLNGSTWLDCCETNGSLIDLASYPGARIFTRKHVGEGYVLADSNITEY